MTEVERRKDYQELGNKLESLGRELAVVNTNLQNVIKMFHDHLADDKETVKRVNSVENRIVGLSAVCTVIGFIAGKVSMKWF